MVVGSQGGISSEPMNRKGIEFIQGGQADRAYHKGMFKMKGNSGVIIKDGGATPSKLMGFIVNVNAKTSGLSLRDQHDV